MARRETTAAQYARGGGITWRSLAVCTCGEPTSLALAAELTVGTEGRIAIHRLTCAVDRGQVVNPLSLRAQIEGGLSGACRPHSGGCRWIGP
jgi:CO/xanthine dehydrogenase Mo-binding subunit